MAFDPTKYKAPPPRRETLYTKLDQLGYWCNSSIKDGVKTIYIHPKEHSITDALARSCNTIQGKPGETLMEIMKRLGWI